MSNVSKTPEYTKSPSQSGNESTDANTILKKRTQRFIDEQTTAALKSKADDAHNLANRRAEMSLVTKTTSVGQGEIQRCGPKAASKDLQDKINKMIELWTQDGAHNGASRTSAGGPGHSRAVPSASTFGNTRSADTQASTSTGPMTGQTRPS
jgi:hypothetical protein